MGCFCPYIYLSIPASLSPLGYRLMLDRTTVERVGAKVLFTALGFNLSSYVPSRSRG
jgi:hypothetical protein